MAARSATRPRAADPVAALQRALGDCVTTDPDDRYAASFDGMKLAYAQPAAVVRPTREEQVGTVLELANTHQLPVTTRGAGSSLTGAATPSKAGWVLDLTRLNRIRIDADARFAHVQAGAVNGKVQAAAARHGLMYPPDPSSRDYCTIGGNIACNAGGLRGAKYGVTRDYVVALRGFLPTGEAVQFGRPLRKWAAGYNLRDLWIGSEGMLGIVTGASQAIHVFEISNSVIEGFGFDTKLSPNNAVTMVGPSLIDAVSNVVSGLSGASDLKDINSILDAARSQIDNADALGTAWKEANSIPNGGVARGCILDGTPECRQLVYSDGFASVYQGGGLSLPAPVLIIANNLESGNWAVFVANFVPTGPEDGP
jgi:FAD/FMN-containing dehydrogenase